MTDPSQIGAAAGKRREVRHLGVSAVSMADGKKNW
jgi:hypothetical protein